jgi:hypothetical protein
LLGASPEQMPLNGRGGPNCPSIRILLAVYFSLLPLVSYKIFRAMLKNLTVIGISEKKGNFVST